MGGPVHCRATIPETGKRIIKNVLGKTQTEVKEKLKSAISESQKLDVSKVGSYTVASWVRTWYEVYAEPRIRPNTKAYYTNYIENHIVPGIGRRPAGQADHHSDPAVLQQPPKERSSSAQEFSRTQGQKPQPQSGAGRPHAAAQLLGAGGGGAADPQPIPPRAASCRSLRNGK